MFKFDDGKETHQFFKDKNCKVEKHTINLEEGLAELGYSLTTAPQRNILYSKVKTYCDYRVILKDAKYFKDNAMADVYDLRKYDPYFDRFEMPILLTDFIEQIKRTPFNSKEEIDKFTKLSKRCERKKRDNNYNTVIVRRTEDFIPEICEQQIETDLDFISRLRYMKSN